MKRRQPAVEALALYAPAMALATAIERLPIDKFAFNKARYRWVEVVRGHPMLTAAQRTVGLAIAQQHINHNPESPWFHSAWAAHQTIATETGLTRRTVNAGEILQRLAGVKVQHGRKQEGPRYRGPSCLSRFIPEGQRPTAALTGLGVTGAWSERA
jgi:hypothetical protein